MCQFINMCVLSCCSKFYIINVVSDLFNFSSRSLSWTLINSTGAKLGY